MSIDIYEEENIFVKYNHLLAKKTITGLKERPKGQTKVVVSFEIDINGSNNKRGSKEQWWSRIRACYYTKWWDYFNTRKNEGIRKKNINLLKRIKNSDSFSKMVYSNLKGKLLIYKNAYEKSKKKFENRNNKEQNDGQDEDNRITYLLNFNETLEAEKLLHNKDDSISNFLLMDKLLYL